MINSSDRLRYATANEMFAVLDSEPSSLIAQLMAGQDWPWAMAFLKILPLVRQERIRTGLFNAADVAPARKAFLIDAISLRLKDATSSNSIFSSEKIWKPFPAIVMRFARFPLARVVMSWTR